MTDLTPEARALIETARAGERPPPDAKGRIQAAVIASIAASGGKAGAATGATAAIKGGTSAGVGLKLLAPIAIVALGVGGAWIGGAFDGSEPTARTSPQPSALSPQPQPEPQHVAPIVEEPEPEPVVVPVVEPVAEPEPEPAPRKVKRVKRVAPAPAPAPTADSIREEMALIQRANAALRDGDGSAAMVIVREHAQRFPSGQMVQEREAARVRALCMAGREDAGRSAAKKFLKRWPKSTYAARVKTACGNSNSNSDGDGDGDGNGNGNGNGNGDE